MIVGTGLSLHPENLPSADKYCTHLDSYCKYLDYMHGMFKAGKEKKDVLDGVISLHRPASYWQEKQAQQSSPSSPTEEYFFRKGAPVGDSRHGI
jgi:hypothetical protein